MDAKLPKCAVCKADAVIWCGDRACCSNPKCECAFYSFTLDTWTRLHARPALAPEHVENMLRLAVSAQLSLALRDSVRAALAELGIEVKP